MADTDFTSTPKDPSSSTNAYKPLVYDLLHRLNNSFAHVHRNMLLLEKAGIFDPLMMQVLNRQSQRLRAGANYHVPSDDWRASVQDGEKGVGGRWLALSARQTRMRIARLKPRRSSLD